MMVQYSKTMLQVIRRWPGEGTGEEKVQTEDGTIWTSVDYLPTIGTGDRHGILFVDKVIER